MTEPTNILDGVVIAAEPFKSADSESRVENGVDHGLDSVDLDREDALKRRRSMSVKKFDLIVPMPISTSTRSFSSSRPPSMSFSVAPVASTSSTGEGGSKKWVVNMPTPLAGFSSSPSKPPRPSRLDLPATPSLTFGKSKSTGTSPIPSDSPAEPRFPSFAGSSSESSDDSASPSASLNAQLLATSAPLSFSLESSETSVLSAPEHSKEGHLDEAHQIIPSTTLSLSNHTSITLATDSDDTQPPNSPHDDEPHKQHKHKRKKSSKSSRRSTSEIDSVLSHSRIDSMNGFSNTEDESSTSTSTATPQRFASPSKLTRASSAYANPHETLTPSSDDSSLLDALVSPRYRPPVPTKSAAMIERRKERQASMVSSSSSAGSSQSSSQPSASTSSTTATSKPPIPKRTSGYFDASAYKLSARASRTNVDADLNGESGETNGPLSVEERNKLRAYLAQELQKTEAFYVKSLRTIVSAYLQPMRTSLTTDDPILAAEQQKQLFSNVEVLLGIHQTFAENVDTILSEWSPTSLLGPALLQLTPFLKIYTQYINNYNKSMHVYQDAMKHKSFRKFIAEAAVGNDLDNWPSYCIQPVQRIPKYLLILTELCKNTPEEHPDFSNLKSALDSLTSMATEINTHKRDAENLTHCAQIQSMVTYPDGVAKIELVTQTRRFCRQGTFDVFINGIASPYNHLVLFNDAILLAKSKKKNLRFDGFLLLAHTIVEDFGGEDDTVASSSSTSTSDLPPLSPNSSSAPNGANHPATSSAAPTGPTAPSSTPTPIFTSHIMHLRSLVIGANVVVKFPNAEELAVWRADAMAGSARPDAIIPETFPDRLVSLELNAAAMTEEPTSPRKSTSLGSSRSKHKLRRLLTLGTGKSSKKDAVSSTIDLATENRASPSSSSSSRIGGHHKSATKDS